jgi:L-rhamnose mutarotase
VDPPRDFVEKKETNMASVKRVASVINLDPAGIAEYEQLHAAAWPAVLAKISECNIRNYSIYRYGLLLFSYFEYVGDDMDGDMDLMGKDPTTQDWWAVCKPLQRPVDEVLEDEWWHSVPEIFHHD